MKDPDTIARELVEYAMALFDDDGERVTTARQAGLRERIAAALHDAYIAGAGDMRERAALAMTPVQYLIDAGSEKYACSIPVNLASAVRALPFVYPWHRPDRQPRRS